MTDLQNLTVLVTRPEPHGAELCAKIRALQGNAIYLPTIEIAPQLDAMAIHQIEQLDTFDMIIFVSQHAVTQSLAQIRAKWPTFPAHCKIAAVGARTAESLRKANLPVMLYPDKDWSSAGLVNLSELQNVTGQRIGIVCGAQGRTLLTEILRERGAHVENIIVYRRDIPRIANLSEYQNLFKEQKIDIMICTSGTGLLHLVEMMSADNQDLLHQVALVVISTRLVALAEQLQFKHVFLADNASHDSIINALTTIRNLLGKIYGGQHDK